MSYKTVNGIKKITTNLVALLLHQSYPHPLFAKMWNSRNVVCVQPALVSILPSEHSSCMLSD